MKQSLKKTSDYQGAPASRSYWFPALHTDALAKLLIEKGLITKAEFMQKLSAERETYQAMVGKMK